MDLIIVEEVLQINISLNAIDKDLLDILDPLYNRDKMYESTVVNVEIAIEENDGIMHKVRHIIKLTRDWIQKPFRLDPLSNVPPLQAPTCPEKGKHKKVALPSFQEKLHVSHETVYKYLRDVAY